MKTLLTVLVGMMLLGTGCTKKQPKECSVTLYNTHTGSTVIFYQKGNTCWAVEYLKDNMGEIQTAPGEVK